MTENGPSFTAMHGRFLRCTSVFHHVRFWSATPVRRCGLATKSNSNQLSETKRARLPRLDVSDWITSLNARRCLAPTQARVLGLDVNTSSTGWTVLDSSGKRVSRCNNSKYHIRAVLCREFHCWWRNINLEVSFIIDNSCAHTPRVGSNSTPFGRFFGFEFYAAHCATVVSSTFTAVL